MKDKQAENKIFLKGVSLSLYEGGRCHETGSGLVQPATPEISEELPL